MSILIGIPGGYVAPPEPVVVPVEPEWSGLYPTWTGWDGSVWDLTGRSGGIALMTGGIRGLSMPLVERFTDSSPALAGSRWRGSRAQEREVFWPLAIYGQPSSREWMEWDRAFWRTMHPDRPGTWTVTHPDGATRRLVCRFADDGDQAFDRMPTRTGWATYGITLVAEDPYWHGDPIVRSFEETPPQQFFGGDASPSGGPPFFISAANTLATATLDNPGDVDAYPVFTIDGPTTSVTLGIGGQSTTVPFALPADRSLTIDTSPAGQLAIDSTGGDRTADLGDVAFVAVPPGEDVPLAINMVGTGRVTVELVPRYLRAW